MSSITKFETNRSSACRNWLWFAFLRRFCLTLLLPAALLADPFDAIRESIRRQLTDSAAPSTSVARVRSRAGDAEQATVRRVANHSSGLPLHHQFFYADEPARLPWKKRSFATETASPPLRAKNISIPISPSASRTCIFLSVFIGVYRRPNEGFSQPESPKRLSIRVRLFR